MIAKLIDFGAEFETECVMFRPVSTGRTFRFKLGSKVIEFYYIFLFLESLTQYFIWRLTFC